MKKVLATLGAATLLTLPITALADTSVKVNATVEPAGTFALNFDALQISGKVGDTDTWADPMKGGSIVFDAPQYKVSTNEYYQLLVSATDLVSNPTDGSEPIRLSSKRLEIATGPMTPIQLTSTPTQLKYSYGYKNEEVNYLDINLNLQNNYEYADILTSIQFQTQLESTLTFSFTSL